MTMNRREFVETLATAALAAGAGRAAAAPAAPAAGFDPSERSIGELSNAQAQGSLSAEALTRSYLDRIERYDRRGPKIGAVLALNPLDRASAQYDLAQAYFGAGQRDKASEHVLASLEIAPGYRPAQKLLLELNAPEKGN